jgi:Cu(I)/Ag(I) efflux system protein CusF
MSKLFVAASALLFALAIQAQAQAQHAGHHGAAPSAPAASAAAQPVAVGAEVRKIDLAQHKLQLRHEYIPHLDMPAMSMVFEVREAADRALLPQLKVGQKLRFVAVQQDGVFVARQLEPQP